MAHHAGGRRGGTGGVSLAIVGDYAECVAHTDAVGSLGIERREIVGRHAILASDAVERLAALHHVGGHPGGIGVDRRPVAGLVGEIGSRKEESHAGFEAVGG